MHTDNISRVGSGIMPEALVAMCQSMRASASHDEALARAMTLRVHGSFAESHDDAIVKPGQVSLGQEPLSEANLVSSHQ